MSNQEATGSIQVSLTLQDIYDVCCSPCRERLIDLIARQAQSSGIKQALRQQLQPDAAPAPAQPPQGAEQLPQ